MDGPTSTPIHFVPLNREIVEMCAQNMKYYYLITLLVVSKVEQEQQQLLLVQSAGIWIKIAVTVTVEMWCISGDGVEFKAFAGAKFGVFWKAKKLLNPSSVMENSVNFQQNFRTIEI